MIRMKYRVVIPNRYPTYFRTRREAKGYQAKFGGKIERKLVTSWVE